MSTTTLTPHDKTYLPTESDSDQAKELFSRLEKEIELSGTSVLLSASGQEYELPPKLFEVLRFVGETLAAGRGVTVVPRDTLLTTQEAADFLGISRPTFVKLLEAEGLPYSKIGRHRRVTLDNLLAYQEKERARRKTILAQSARDSQISGMLDLTVMPGINVEQ